MQHAHINQAQVGDGSLTRDVSGNFCTGRARAADAHGAGSRSGGLYAKHAARAGVTRVPVCTLFVTSAFV